MMGASEFDSASGSDHGGIMKVFFPIVPLNVEQGCGAFDYRRHPKCGRPILIVAIKIEHQPIFRD